MIFRSLESKLLELAVEVFYLPTIEKIISNNFIQKGTN